MKPRPVHLSVKRTMARTWEVRVMVADGGWQIAEVGTMDEALTLALDIIRQRRVQEVQVAEVTA